jgi:polyphenol oxidase
VSVASAAGVRVREVMSRFDPPIWSHPGWAERFTWLVQGTTGRGVAEPYDLGLAGASAVGARLRRWRGLMAALEVGSAVHAIQEHGAGVRTHTAVQPGLLIDVGVDGHATDRAGLLLSVSVADCVPIFLVDEEHRRVAVLHAGWRGVAGGILEAGVAVLSERDHARPERLWLHLGPAICGDCYPVGPEVHVAVRGVLEHNAREGPIDLRAELIGRALALGVPEEQCSASELCTRCTRDDAGRRPFFSHRGGDAGRQMGLIAVRA